MDSNRFLFTFFRFEILWLLQLIFGARYREEMVEKKYWGERVAKVQYNDVGCDKCLGNNHTCLMTLSENSEALVFTKIFLSKHFNL